MFKILPCIDSVEMAASRQQELDIQRNVAAELGRSAVEAAVEGQYVYEDGRKVDWSRFVQAACSSMDIPPLFLVHGAAVLLRTILTVLLPILGMLWKTTFAERSLTSCLPSQIGRRRGNSLGLSVMFLLKK